jgi:predicted ATP-grasp superfamily ATP-dependent carboligase
MVREMMSDNLRVVDLVKIQFNGMITVHEKGLNTLPFAIFASEDQIVQVWRRA